MACHGKRVLTIVPKLYVGFQLCIFLEKALMSIFLGDFYFFRTYLQSNGIDK